MEKYIAVLIVVMVLFIVLITHQEGFSDRNEKARSIYDWFSETPDPSYTAYRGAFGGESNIVDYESVRKLFGEKNLTLKTVHDALG